MDTPESSALHAHPSAEDQDHHDHDERPHACYEGVVYIGRLVVGHDGEETEVIEAVPCRRCADEASL